MLVSKRAAFTLTGHRPKGLPASYYHHDGEGHILLDLEEYEDWLRLHGLAKKPMPERKQKEGPLPWVARRDKFTYTITFPCCARSRLTTNLPLTDPNARWCRVCLRKYPRITDDNATASHRAAVPSDHRGSAPACRRGPEEKRHAI